MARQAFIAGKLNMGEPINNFIRRLQKLAEHCDYGKERDNQVRDHAISYIKDKNLESKLYREETLTLNKLMEIVGEYHDQEVLILLSDRVNNIQISSKNKGWCWRCDKTRPVTRDPQNRPAVKIVWLCALWIIVNTIPKTRKCYSTRTKTMLQPVTTKQVNSNIKFTLGNKPSRVQ